jgi:hypothetical protein
LIKVWIMFVGAIMQAAQQLATMLVVSHHLQAACSSCRTE